MEEPFEPAYLSLLESGELHRRADTMMRGLAACRLCPRECGANRLRGESGVCGVDARILVSSVFPHFGEEPPLVGLRGSGTIFFCGCNLKCVFCQNSSISWDLDGQHISIEDLAEHMLALERGGCHNINFVTPTHYVPQILSATEIAARSGLSVPIVYNTGGYDSLDTLRLLDGVIDIYMPDMKYSSPEAARKFSSAPDYADVVFAAVREMHRQVGDLALDARGIATRGLLVRHLVMPEGLAESEAIFRFLAEEISKDTYLNIMDQYRPAHRAHRYPEIGRPTTAAEYTEAIHSARKFGLYCGF